MSRTYHHGDRGKQRKFGERWLWYRATPSAWNRCFHTKPRRAQERQLIHRAMRIDYEQVWPLGSRKPHEYYY